MLKLHKTLALMVLLATTAHASDIKILENTPDRLTATTISVYTLGDGDSRLDARNMAWEAAKQDIAELAGSYVQSETTLQNGQITEQNITAFAAAVMSSKILTENIKVGQDGRMSLELTVQANVDKKALHARANVAGSMKDLRLKELEAENQVLKEQLMVINRQIRTPADKPVGKGLLAERDKVLSRLEENRGVIQRVFEGVSLREMAISDARTQDMAFQDIDYNYFRYIQDNLLLTPGSPVFLKDPQRGYIMKIPVRWSIDTTPLRFVLDKYYDGDQGRYVFSDILRKYIDRSVGAYKAYVGFGNKQTWSNINGQFKVSDMTNPKNIGHVSGELMVSFEGLAEKDLAGADRVTAWLHLYRFPYWND